MAGHHKYSPKAMIRAILKEHGLENVPDKQAQTNLSHLFQTRRQQMRYNHPDYTDERIFREIVSDPDYIARVIARCEQLSMEEALDAVYREPNPKNRIALIRSTREKARRAAQRKHNALGDETARRAFCSPEDHPLDTISLQLSRQMARLQSELLSRDHNAALRSTNLVQKTLNDLTRMLRSDMIAPTDTRETVYGKGRRKSNTVVIR